MQKKPRINANVGARETRRDRQSPFRGSGTHCSPAWVSFASLRVHSRFNESLRLSCGAPTDAGKIIDRRVIGEIAERHLRTTGRMEEGVDERAETGERGGRGVIGRAAEAKQAFQPGADAGSIGCAQAFEELSELGEKL